MKARDSQFASRLLETFRQEAEEHLGAITRALTELERCTAAPRRAELVETAFREAHSLKGSAQAVHAPALEGLCRALENALAALKHGQATLSEELLRALDSTVGSLERLLPVATGGGPGPAADSGNAGALLEQALLAASSRFVNEDSAAPAAATAMARGTVPSPPAAAPEARPAEDSAPLAETVRLPVARLNALMVQAEELRTPKLMAAQRAMELRGLAASLRAWKQQRARLVPVLRQLRQAPGNGAGDNGRSAAPKRLLEFLEQTDTVMADFEQRCSALAHDSEADQRALAGQVDALLDDARRVLMLPMSSLLEGFPRLVRELARDGGKRVELEIHGADLEADRRLLQELKAPLIHLVRNVIDHGIEAAAERARRDKPAAGKVRIAASALEGGRFELLVEDDGAGVDVVRAREAAVRVGAISQEQAERLDEASSLALIFESGVSTSPILTDLSGRGLGLAIVREKVERLGGAVTVTSRRGAGTTFRITLPLTLASFRGVMVRVQDSWFVIPVAAVERAQRVAASDIRTVENRETLDVEGQAVSLLGLGDVLGAASVTPPGTEERWRYVVVLRVAGKRIAFRVDEVAAEQEVVVKNLGRLLGAVKNVAGTTVLSSGRVVPILHAADLMKAAVDASARRVEAQAAARPKRERSVLVAEDSITARALLKNILESAGYRVKTAVDGAEAFALLKTEEFDLVVSDVEMPRMSGFDLTARIRAEKKLADLPVVLVTALESREDRERGIDAGANAYLVKSSFDHSNLLEVVGRLL
jgi:two-component system chemotaxis sensor kinase CheA